MDKLLPHDIDAEEAMLGAFLIGGQKAFRQVVHQVKDIDLYSERNRWIFKACADLYSRREAINEITVSQELSRQDKLANIGGAAFLPHLIDSCPTSLDVEYYGKIVYRMSLNRKLIAMSDQLADIGYQTLPDTSQTIDKAVELFESFKKSNTVIGNDVTTPQQAGNDIMEMLDKYSEPANYIKWGFRDMDNITAGISPEYHIFGARPSVGKTQVLLDIACNVTEQNKTVLFVSAEMTKQQIYERLLAREANISILDLRKHGMNEDQEKKVLELAGNISESTLHTLCKNVYLNDIYREVYNMLEKDTLDMVIVDYLGALRDAYSENRDSQATRISRISNKIQAMVHEFNIPFLVASQLNREVEHRNDNQGKGQNKARKPQLSDLRDSGSIEQDADVVFLLHRELEADDRYSPLLRVKMAKNRQLGPARSITLLYNYNLHRYVNYSERED